MNLPSSLKSGFLQGFVPHPLKLADRPELQVFPVNVLFRKSVLRHGRTITGQALYEPDLTSFRAEDNRLSLIYHNIYGANNQLMISFDIKTRNYSGIKQLDGKTVLSSSAAGWSRFFAHLTMAGLVNGEGVRFEAENKT